METINDKHNDAESTKNPPKDNYNLVYIICCWLGIAMLFPWNFFYNADGYWRLKFKETHNNTIRLNDTLETSMQIFWGSSLSLVSMAPNFFFLFINAIIGHKFRIIPRLYGSLIFNILLFIISVAFTKTNTDSWQEAFFYISLIIALIFNTNDSIFQGAFAALMGRFPSSYISALSQGQALGGTIASVISVTFFAIGGSAVNMALFSFIFAAVFLTSACFLLFYVSKKEFFKFYAPNEESIKNGTEGRRVNFRLVIRETWVFNLAVFLNFFVTLGVFPSMGVLTESTSDNETWVKYYHIVGCFLVFNACDLIGRVMHTLIKWPKPTRIGAFVTLAVAVARLAFIPLFMFCNVRPDNRINSKVLFKSDAAFVIINVLFSLTNGYIANVCMSCSPKMVKEPDNQGVAASITVAMLVFGLCVGSGFSFIWVLLL